MRISLTASKDTYITDRVIRGTRRHGANLGQAGTIDLFKLYGVTLSGSSANIELSRGLVKFDLSPLSREVSSGRCSLSHSSFKATLRMMSSIGGQPTPPSFTAVIHPLSSSWDEGLGRDVSLYADGHVANFLTSSFAGALWVVSGAGSVGNAGTTCDAIETVAGTLVSATSSFETGEEDMVADVTRAVSATLAGLLPDNGFRIAFTSSIETDSSTWFVKRFFSRHASDQSLRPVIVASWDDSVNDDSGAMRFGTTGRIAYQNTSFGRPQNFTSASVSVTGSNCLMLKLVTAVSGGFVSQSFTGSQVQAPVFVTGSYYADCSLTNTDQLRVQMAKSGSVTFKSYWESLDGTVGYVTGSDVVVFGERDVPLAIPFANVAGIPHIVKKSDNVRATCFLDAYEDRDVANVSRIPTRRPTAIRHDVHYRIRDAATGQLAIDSDTATNSTRMSNTYDYYYFKLPLTVLVPGKSYAVEAVFYDGSTITLLPGSGVRFTVTE